MLRLLLNFQFLANYKLIELSISFVNYGLIMTLGIYFCVCLFVFFSRLMKYMQKTIHGLVLTLQVIGNTS